MSFPDEQIRLEEFSAAIQDAYAEYGVRFPAMIQRGNVSGVQFHPEKSSEVGMRILRSFIEC